MPVFCALRRGQPIEAIPRRWVDDYGPGWFSLWATNCSNFSSRCFNAAFSASSYQRRGETPPGFGVRRQAGRDGAFARAPAPFRWGRARASRATVDASSTVPLCGIAQRCAEARILPDREGAVRSTRGACAPRAFIVHLLPVLGPAIVPASPAVVSTLRSRLSTRRSVGLSRRGVRGGRPRSGTRSR